MKFLSQNENSYPSLLLSNIQSLVPKHDEICLFASVSHPDIMIFCETWLSENFVNETISIPGYGNPLRHDRSNKRGGGVCMYCRADILVHEITITSSPPAYIECLWTAFSTWKTIILALYVPPNLSSSQLNEVTAYIESEADNALNLFSESKLIILGDLNHLSTEDLESTFGLKQVVDQPTRKRAILDKILLDHKLIDYFHPPIVGPNFGAADHLSVYLKPRNDVSHCVQIKKVCDYRQSNLLAFSERLRKFPWQTLYNPRLSVDEKCDIFYEAVNESLSAIPTNYVEMSARDKPWVTPLLKHLINCRYEAYRHGQFDKYNHLKGKIKQEIEKAKSRWMENLKNSRSGIWEAVRSVSGKQKSSKLCDGTSSPEAMANNLNEQFSSVFTPLTLTDDVVLPEIDTTLNEEWPIVIDEKLISRQLTRLKSNKSSGNDNLSTRLLKFSHDVIAAPLTHLFAESILHSTVPARWKAAKISPIPKCTKPSLADFRPVSLLPIPSKMLEKIVLDSIKTQLISLYGKSQYGFRPKSSTLNAHLVIHDYVTRSIDSSCCDGVAMIALDLSKAFDRVSHLSLLQTLVRGNFPYKLILWMRNFLTERTQRVVFNGMPSSRDVPVSSGVPQGSVLAPFLFAAQVGSLAALHPQTKLIKYADDFTLLIPYSRSKEPFFIKCVKSEIDNIKTWCMKHSLIINDDKTKSLFFAKSNPSAAIQRNLPVEVAELKVLGITYQKSLKWDRHVECITKAAGRRIHVLRYLRHIRSITKKDLVTVCNNYILSILEFNSPLLVGLNIKNSEKMERIRRRCHKIVCGLQCSCDAFPSLKQRREIFAMKVFGQIMSKNHISHELLPHYLPRTGKLFQEFIRTERRAKSFVPFCLLRWNSNKERVCNDIASTGLPL